MRMLQNYHVNILLLLVFFLLCIPCTDSFINKNFIRFDLKGKHFNSRITRQFAKDEAQIKKDEVAITPRNMRRAPAMRMSKVLPTNAPPLFRYDELQAIFPITVSPHLREKFFTLCYSEAVDNETVKELHSVFKLIVKSIHDTYSRPEVPIRTCWSEILGIIQIQASIHQKVTNSSSAELWNKLLSNDTETQNSFLQIFSKYFELPERLRNQLSLTTSEHAIHYTNYLIDLVKLIFQDNYLFSYSQLIGVNKNLLIQFNLVISRLLLLIKTTPELLPVKHMNSLDNYLFALLSADEIMDTISEEFVSNILFIPTIQDKFIANLPESSTMIEAEAILEDCSNDEEEEEEEISGVSSAKRKKATMTSSHHSHLMATYMELPESYTSTRWYKKLLGLAAPGGKLFTSHFYSILVTRELFSDMSGFQSSFYHRNHSTNGDGGGLFPESLFLKNIYEESIRRNISLTRMNYFDYQFLTQQKQENYFYHYLAHYLRTVRKLQIPQYIWDYLWSLLDVNRFLLNPIQRPFPADSSLRPIVMNSTIDFAEYKRVNHYRIFLLLIKLSQKSPTHQRNRLFHLFFKLNPYCTSLMSRDTSLVEPVTPEPVANKSIPLSEIETPLADAGDNSTSISNVTTADISTSNDNSSVPLPNQKPLLPPPVTPPPRSSQYVSMSDEAFLTYLSCVSEIFRLRRGLDSMVRFSGAKTIDEFNSVIDQMNSQKKYKPKGKSKKGNDVIPLEQLEVYIPKKIIMSEIINRFVQVNQTVPFHQLYALIEFISTLDSTWIFVNGKGSMKINEQILNTFREFNKPHQSAQLAGKSPSPAASGVPLQGTDPTTGGDLSQPHESEPKSDEEPPAPKEPGSDLPVSSEDAKASSTSASVALALPTHSFFELHDPYPAIRLIVYLLKTFNPEVFLRESMIYEEVIRFLVYYLQRKAKENEIRQKAIASYPSSSSVSTEKKGFVWKLTDLYHMLKLLAYSVSFEKDVILNQKAFNRKRDSYFMDAVSNVLEGSTRLEVNDGTETRPFFKAPSAFPSPDQNIDEVVRLEGEFFQTFLPTFEKEMRRLHEYFRGVRKIISKNGFLFAEDNQKDLRNSTNAKNARNKEEVPSHPYYFLLSSPPSAYISPTAGNPRPSRTTIRTEVYQELSYVLSLPHFLQIYLIDKLNLEIDRFPVEVYMKLTDRLLQPIFLVIEEFLLILKQTFTPPNSQLPSAPSPSSLGSSSTTSTDNHKKDDLKTESPRTVEDHASQTPQPNQPVDQPKVSKFTQFLQANQESFPMDPKQEPKTNKATATSDKPPVTISTHWTHEIPPNYFQKIASFLSALNRLEFPFASLPPTLQELLYEIFWPPINENCRLPPIYTSSGRVYHQSAGPSASASDPSTNSWYSPMYEDTNAFLFMLKEKTLYFFEFLMKSNRLERLKRKKSIASSYQELQNERDKRFQEIELKAAEFAYKQSMRKSKRLEKYLMEHDYLKPEQDRQERWKLLLHLPDIPEDYYEPEEYNYFLDDYLPQKKAIVEQGYKPKLVTWDGQEGEGDDDEEQEREERDEVKNINKSQKKIKKHHGDEDIDEVEEGKEGQEQKVEGIPLYLKGILLNEIFGHLEHLESFYFRPDLIREKRVSFFNGEDLAMKECLKLVKEGKLDKLGARQRYQEMIDEYAASRMTLVRYLPATMEYRRGNELLVFLKMLRSFEFPKNGITDLGRIPLSLPHLKQVDGMIVNHRSLLARCYRVLQEMMRIERILAHEEKLRRERQKEKNRQERRKQRLLEFEIAERGGAGESADIPDVPVVPVREKRVFDEVFMESRKAFLEVMENFSVDYWLKEVPKDTEVVEGIKAKRSFLSQRQEEFGWRGSRSPSSQYEGDRFD